MVHLLRKQPDRIYHLFILICLIGATCGCNPRLLRSKRTYTSSVLPSEGYAEDNFIVNRDSQEVSADNSSEGANKAEEVSPDNLPVFDNEARLSDIAIPIDVVLYDMQGLHEEAQRKVAIRYLSDQSVESLVAFYRAEMECMGWYEASLIKAVHSCLIFEKQFKRCAIFIENCGSQTRVSIYSAPNENIT